MKEFKTKKEALVTNGAKIGEQFSIKDRENSIFELNKVSSKKYITKVIGGRNIFELSDALELAESCGIHIGKTEFVDVFVDDGYNKYGEKFSPIKRAIVSATVTTKDGLEYTTIGSAGADNVSKSLRSYIVEIASKRAVCRAIISALKLKDVWVDVEFSPDVLMSMGEYKKSKTVSTKNQTEMANSTQINAINSILKRSPKLRDKVLNGYNVKNVSELTALQAKKTIIKLQSLSKE